MQPAERPAHRRARLMGQLEKLPPEVQGELLAAGTPRRFKRNHVVFYQGDPAGSLYIVRSGKLAVQMGAPSGTNTIVAVLNPGDLFGELAVLRGTGRRSTTVIALEASTTTMVTEQAFQAVRQAYPCIDQMLISMLADRLVYMDQRLAESHGENVFHRCISRLAELLPTGNAPVALRITQEHLAELVGTTRPSVNGALSRLQDRCTVCLARGTITVVGPAGLRAEAARRGFQSAV